MDNNIYTRYIFRDRSTDQLIRELIVNKNTNPAEKISMTIKELMEHYSLAETDIIVEN